MEFYTSAPQFSFFCSQIEILFEILVELRRERKKERKKERERERERERETERELWTVKQKGISRIRGRVGITRNKAKQLFPTGTNQN